MSAGRDEVRLRRSKIIPASFDLIARAGVSFVVVADLSILASVFHPRQTGKLKRVHGRLRPRKSLLPLRLLTTLSRHVAPSTSNVLMHRLP